MTSNNRRTETATQSILTTAATELTTSAETSSPSQATVTTMNTATVAMATLVPESKILYVWVPYAFFLFGIFVVLTASFVQRWKRVLKRRRVLMDYIEADVLAKRPRIFRIFSQSCARPEGHVGDKPYLYDCSLSTCCWNRSHQPSLSSTCHPTLLPGGRGGNGQLNGQASYGERPVVIGEDTNRTQWLSSSTSSAVPSFCPMYRDGDRISGFGNYPSHGMADYLHKESREGHCCGLGARSPAGQGDLGWFQKGLCGQRNLAFSFDEDVTSRCCTHHALPPLHLQRQTAEGAARRGGRAGEEGGTGRYQACHLQQHTPHMPVGREPGLHHDHAEGESATARHHIHSPNAHDSSSHDSYSTYASGNFQRPPARGYCHPPQPDLGHEGALLPLGASAADHTERCFHCGSIRGAVKALEATARNHIPAPYVSAQQSACSSSNNTLETVAAVAAKSLPAITSGLPSDISVEESSDETRIIRSIQSESDQRGSDSISVFFQRGNAPSAMPKEETGSGSTGYTTLTLQSLRSSRSYAGPSIRAASAGSSMDRVAPDVFTIELNDRDPPTGEDSDCANSRLTTDESLRRATRASYLPSQRQPQPLPMVRTPPARPAQRHSTHQSWALKRERFSKIAVTSTSHTPTRTDSVPSKSSSKNSLTVPTTAPSLKFQTLSVPSSESSIFWLSSTGSDMEQTLV